MKMVMPRKPSRELPTSGSNRQETITMVIAKAKAMIDALMKAFEVDLTLAPNESITDLEE